MEHCQSLEALTLEKLDMDEDHCRALGAYSRPDLKIELKHCRITGSGASALAEVLGRNQGPTKLTLCEIDNCVLANGIAEIVVWTLTSETESSWQLRAPSKKTKASLT
jgi:hypothetical protein